MEEVVQRPGFIQNPELTAIVLHKGKKIEIEAKCTTCSFGSLDEHVDPCLTCFKRWTAEKPYAMWEFDENYDPDDDVY